MSEQTHSSSVKVPGLLGKVGYRVWVAVGYLVLALLCALGISSEFQQIDENMETLARERGSVLFRLIELTRDWNANHGGVYVPVTDEVQPNPYLKSPQRDLKTLEGIRLTMINPAYMTRQIGELAEKVHGVKFHMTSLKPVRPENAADPWEADALRLFEHSDRRSVLSLLESGDGLVHRYIAPLAVKRACLTCHRSEGYKVGDIRGGISITMPAGQVLAIRQEQRQRAMQLFGVAALSVAFLIHFVAWRSRQYFLRLREITAGQERLITERTEELSRTNAHLLEELAVRRRNERQINDARARYRSVIEASQDGILIVRAPEFTIGFVNERAAAILGFAPEELIGHSAIEYIHPLDRESAAERMERRLRGEPVEPTSRLRFVRPGDPRIRVGDVHVAKIDVGPDEVQQWVVNVRDITSYIADERALQIAAAVMENAAEGIIVTDADKRIIQVNPAFTMITGFLPREAQGRSPEFLGAGQRGAEYFASIWKALEEIGHWEGEFWIRRRDGVICTLWLAISEIRGEAAGDTGRFVATFIDITQRKEAEELLRHKAQSDPLTDLPNRGLFFDRLQMAMTQARRYGDEFALLFIDLDYFKAVNDTMGHAAGDELLIETARRLRLVVRESDTVARLGGDEFAVVLSKIASRSEAEEVAQRIVSSLGQVFMLASGEARVSASVGVAIYPDHGSDMDILKRSADAALYDVKAKGRNGYQVFSQFKEDLPPAAPT